MQTPAQPADERSRLDTLRALHILDTDPEERFDRLTRLARRLFDVPIALVSLVDANRQWFKSCDGLDVRETPRDISFCGHAILGDDVFVVPDTHKDERFKDNPLVTGGPGIRFYAGCPLQVPNGSKLGTLCLIDVVARKLGDDDLELLRDLAKMVEQEIAAIQLATQDELTQLVNRRGFSALAQLALNACKRMGKPASLLFFDLDGFKEINDVHGHAEGDRALITFADLLRASLRNCDVPGRVGGDEFVALLTDSDPAGVTRVVQRLQQWMDVSNKESPHAYAIRYSVGQVAYDAQRHASIADLLKEADAAMYAHKQASNAEQN